MFELVVELFRLVVVGSDEEDDVDIVVETEGF